MVLLEEIEDDEEEQLGGGEQNSTSSATADTTKQEVTLKKGFLEQTNEPLYPPQGSPEGHVSPETHKAHAEHHMSEDLNKGMNRGADNNNGIERPPWYTKEWPKDCQYNSPGCRIEELETSKHQSAAHREMARGMRWEEAMAPGAKRMSFAFNQITDEEIAKIAEHLKGNRDVTELDLSHNHIKDSGVQKLVGVLSGGAAPNLRELRIHSNEFSDLGKVMLTKGLPVFRKKLEIYWEEPSWMKEAKEANAQA
jgi:hypothetical protein